MVCVCACVYALSNVNECMGEEMLYAVLFRAETKASDTCHTYRPKTKQGGGSSQTEPDSCVFLLRCSWRKNLLLLFVYSGAGLLVFTSCQIYFAPAVAVHVKYEQTFT